MKRLLLLLFVTFFVSAILAQTAEPPASGDGSSGDPYQIETLNNLYWITQNSDEWDKHYIQIADIDASSTSGWDSGNGFSPIGNDTTYFTGSYNGQEYIIDGLFIDRASTDGVGLFGRTNGAEFNSIALINVDITGNNLVGGLAGWNWDNSTISNSYATGSVSGDDSVGGLVGCNEELSTVNNSYATGSGNGTGNNVGGLVGKNWNSSTVSNSYATGSVNGTGDVGGLVGFNSASTVENSFWDSETSGQSSSAGGSGKTTAEMKNVRTFTDVAWSDGLDTPWDFVGNPYDDTGTDNYWNIDRNINAGYPNLSWQTANPPADPPVSGDGSSGDPFQIATLNNLYWITLNPHEWDKHYIQTADIDASSTSSWNNGNGFSPIGNNTIPFQEGSSFQGTYNGQYHTIDGLFIDRASTDYVGLFGKTYYAEFNNIGVINVNITGYDFVGGLTGHNNQCDISNSYVTGSVYGHFHVGGLVGHNYNASNISNSYTAVFVSGEHQVGGLTGNNWNSSTISKSYATGSVNAGDEYVGGLVGTLNYSSTVSNSFSTGSVSGSGFVGGLVGSSSSPSTVINSYATGSVSSSGYVGGLMGWGNSIVTNSFWDMETTGQSTSWGGTGKTSAEMKDVVTFTDISTVGLDTPWDFVGDPYDDTGTNDLWNLDSCINERYPHLSWQTCSPTAESPANGDGASGNPYQIATLNNLYWLMLNPGEWDKYYIQIADIDATSTSNLYGGNGFSPIGNSTIQFTGSYNGQNYTIDGLFINRESTQYIGLFERANSATFSNIGLINVDITGDDNIGPLVGRISICTVSNCYATGSMSGDRNIGGLIGRNNISSTISNSYAICSINGHYNVGGLVGRSLGSSIINNSFADCTVSGIDKVGGLVGWNDEAEINNSYAIGSVTGTDYIGGLVGQNANSSLISNSYSTGLVNGSSDIGGLVGDNTSTIENSFWDMVTSGQSTSDGGTGKTTEEMKDVATFTDLNTVGLDTPWDFVGDPYDDTGTGDHWNIDSSINAGYPYSSWQVYNPPADSPAIGDGTSGNPYQIATLNNLYWITVNPGEWDKHYIQTADIDASSTTGWANGSGFSPIGNWSTTRFIGSYNGQEYIIDGLFINRASTDDVGLFGCTDGALIENISVTNVDITGNDYVGGLVGGNLNNSIINNANTSGSVNGSNRTGGLIGYNTSFSNISNCYSSCSVNGTNELGGLVGGNGYSSTVSNSNASGSVTGVNQIGGLVGFNNQSDISNSYSTGSVSGSSYIGGLVGDSNTSIEENSFWDTETSGQSTSDGGTGKTTLEMKNVRTFTDVIWSVGLDTPWDFVGDPYDDTGTDNFWNIDYSRTNDGYPFLSWQEADTPSVDPPASGDGTSGNPYQIATLNNLYWIMLNPDEWDKHYIQIADIDAASTSVLYGSNGFIPIGNYTTRFTGSYNGQEYIIDGLYIDRASTDYVGLFGLTNGAAFNSIGVINVDITGDYEVGGLVGYNDSSTINNCYATGSLSGVFFVGGLVGINSSSSISSSYSACSVFGSNNFIGSLVGRNVDNSIVSNCYTTGSTIGYAYVGGLVGRNEDSSALNNNYSTGSVSGNNYVGGLVGYNLNSSTVSNSYSAGFVSGSSLIGGLVGDNNTSTVDNSFWDTETSGQSTSDGGTGKTTLEMNNVRTFTDVSWSVGLDSPWDFVTDPYNDTGTDDFWNMDGLRFNDGYPFLSWQYVPPPAAPTNVIITINGDNVELSWDDMGATTYNIYRSTNPYAGDWGDAFDSSAINSYTDVGAASGIKYFYYVTAND